MPDPTDPTDRDLLEDEQEPRDLDVEAPEADAAEQHTDVRPHRDEPLTGGVPGEADPADAADQRRVIDLDEDDYRQ